MVREHDCERKWYGIRKENIKKYKTNKKREGKERAAHWDTEQPVKAANGKTRTTTTSLHLGHHKEGYFHQSKAMVHSKVTILEIIFILNIILKKYFI